MKKFVLDTNILIHMVRNSPTAQRTIADLELNSGQQMLMISVVSLAEVRAFALKNEWGTAKMNRLNNLVKQFWTLDISSDNASLMAAYAEIDAFSQGRLKDRPLGTSARNMGKNDLWIAATAHAAQATLISTDGDFDHLHPAFIQVVKVAP